MRGARATDLACIGWSRSATGAACRCSPCANRAWASTRRPTSQCVHVRRTSPAGDQRVRRGAVRAGGAVHGARGDARSARHAIGAATPSSARLFGGRLLDARVLRSGPTAPTRCWPRRTQRRERCRACARVARRALAPLPAARARQDAQPRRGASRSASSGWTLRALRLRSRSRPRWWARSSSTNQIAPHRGRPVHLALGGPARGAGTRRSTTSSTGRSTSGGFSSRATHEHGRGRPALVQRLPAAVLTLLPHQRLGKAP